MGRFDYIVLIPIYRYEMFIPAGIPHIVVRATLVDYLCLSKFKSKVKRGSSPSGVNTTSREGTLHYIGVTGKEPSVQVAIYSLRLSDLSLISDEIQRNLPIW